MIQQDLFKLIKASQFFYKILAKYFVEQYKATVSQGGNNPLIL